jgi:hypothetical protein
LSLLISAACSDLPTESDAGRNTNDAGDAGGRSDAGGGGDARDGGDTDASRDASTLDANDAAPLDGSIMRLPFGAACDAADECASELCVDGVCCASVCGTCGECVAPSGTCVAIASGEDPDSCIAPRTCSLGDCLGSGVLGAPCGQAQDCASNACVDGVCCTTNSCGACQSCAVGAGTCATLTSQDDPDACTGGSTCDAAGACRLAPGSACGAAGECASDSCVGGHCCSTTCSGVCQGCDFNGTCMPVRNQDGPECSGDFTCSTQGECLVVDQEQLVAGSAAVALSTGTVLGQTWTAGRAGNIVEIRVALSCDPDVSVTVLLGDTQPDGKPSNSGFAGTAGYPGQLAQGELFAVPVPSSPVAAGDTLFLTLYPQGACSATAAPDDMSYYAGGDYYLGNAEQTEWSTTNDDLVFQILMGD